MSIPIPKALLATTTLSTDSALQNCCSMISCISLVNAAVNNVISLNSKILESPGGLAMIMGSISNQQLRLAQSYQERLVWCNETRSSFFTST